MALPFVLKLTKVSLGLPSLDRDKDATSNGGVFDTSITEERGARLPMPSAFSLAAKISGLGDKSPLNQVAL